MKVRQEIAKYSDEEDKPILNDLLDRYSWQSQWEFVAHAEFVPKKGVKWGGVRKWSPTREGKILWKHMQEEEKENG